MKKKVIALACASSLVVLTGCEGLRAAIREKSTQGMALGSLVGAGTLTLMRIASDHRSDLGTWAGGGALLGALAGWCVGHLFEEPSHPVPTSPPALAPSPTTRD